MKIIRNISAMSGVISSFKKKNYKIGFVPTMGALHEGHLSLVRRAKKDCEKTVVSIFVNPTQFGPKEDLKKYPRDFNKDKALLQKEKVDILFYPSTVGMYPEGYSAYVDVGKISEILCGKSRPGHFKGVATVVAKLFNIISPDAAYFGQKDAQQLVVIKRMARDLNFSVDVIGMPIVRESGGLAMSSRNKYLSKSERFEALNLNRSLKLAKELIENNGFRSKRAIVIKLKEFFSIQSKKIKIDYIDIRKWDSLDEIEDLKGDILVAIAAWVEKTRLIDNVILKIR